MANPTHVQQYGDHLSILFDDGSRKFAYNTGTLWTVTNPSTPVSTELFMWPFNPQSTSDEYGWRTDPPGFHHGLDFPNPAGTPIPVAGNGTVIRAGWNSALGNYTIVQHADMGGFWHRTGYAHQTDIYVSVGQTVTKGDIIGTVGNTGSASYGNHLHWETWTNDPDLVDPAAGDNRVNPRLWMAKYQYG